MSEPGPGQVASDAVEHLANGADKVANALGSAATDTAKVMAHAAEAMGNSISKLGPEAWDILVRQQRVSGIVECAVHLGGVVFLISLIKAGNWLARMKMDDGEERGFRRNGEETKAFWPMLAAAGLFCVLVYRSFFVVPESIKMIANPKYYAALSLMEAVKK